MSATRTEPSKSKRTSRSQRGKATAGRRSPRGRAPRSSARAAVRRTRLAREGAVPRMPRPGSAMHAVILVLDGKRKPMSTAEIWSEVVERGLATNLKGKTPDQTLAAAVAVHAKKGLYVERTAPGKFRLKKGVDAKALAATLPSASATAPAASEHQPTATSEPEAAAA